MKVDYEFSKNYSLSAVTHSIRHNGFAIINDFISDEPLDVLNPVLCRTAAELALQNAWAGFGAVKGHLQINPPRHAPYLFKEILSNPKIIDITHDILGEGLFNNFYSSNTNCPGSLPQAAHPDWTPLWPNHRIDHPPVSLVINIPLIDVTASNGATEIWPGTHLCQPSQKIIPKGELEARQSISPPMRLSCQKGSVIIRDSRLWHRGMPNQSSTPRVMLAMIHNIYWYFRGECWPYHISAKPILTSPRLVHHATFTISTINHQTDLTQGMYQVALDPR